MSRFKHSPHGMSRRDFIRLTLFSSAGFITGCATNPVTGESQLMLVSEDQEIAIDRSNSPHQFSGDYGPLQDERLNAYIAETGNKMARQTHRPNMPYSFRGVNAVYVNAYAFPGGSIACTRGILLALDNEAELAALLGHELGHVNARHTAEQMSKGMLVSMAVAGVAGVAGMADPTLGRHAAGLGNVGAGALLAKYSRDNEREADDLGMTYMVGSRYNPSGMVGLMDMLRSRSKAQPGAFELMFATHPMNRERYDRVVNKSRAQYGFAGEYPVYRERYMDYTAVLRSKRTTIEGLQRGETEMARNNFNGAERYFKKALNNTPDDYAGLVLMAKCTLAQERFSDASRYAALAKESYPREAQAYQVSGIAEIMEGRFGSAYVNFNQYDNLLPGNPSILFLKGYSLEGMGNPKKAAKDYYRYLQVVNQGDQANYAYNRLVQWGYIRQSR